MRKRWFSWGDEEVVAQALTTGQRTSLFRDGADARYVPTGHLVFMRRGQLLAVPFDPVQPGVRHKPELVLDNVAQALTAINSSDVTGAGQFAVAPTGMLAWLESPVVPFGDRELVTVDRRGRVAPLPVKPRSFSLHLRLSPDGRRLAVSIIGLTEQGLWLYDVERWGTPTLLNREGESSGPSGSRSARNSASRSVG